MFGNAMEYSDLSSYVQMFVCSVLFLGLISYGPKILLDRRLKTFLAYLNVHGTADFSFVSSGLTYFGSLLGTYNGVYIELIVESIEDATNGIQHGFSSHSHYRLKPFLCYSLTYKGKKRYGQFQVFDAIRNFSEVQEKLLKDVETLLSLDPDE